APVFGTNFQEPLLHLCRVGMITIAVAEPHFSAGTKAEEALNRFEVFYRQMVHLSPQLKQYDGAGARAINNQDARQNRNVPEREPCTKVPGPKASHQASGFRTNPTPRTV